MQFCIQDPSYENSMYLHETLLTECESGISGAGAYAFATKDGINLLLADDSFKQFVKRGTYYLIVGMDDITNLHSLETLQKLKSLYGENLIVKAYIHNSQGSTFHPKYSWFQKENGGVLILGSGNLTQKGLRLNREAYSVVDFEGESFNTVIQEWERWLKHSAPFLFEIDDEIVIARAKQNTANIQAVYRAKKEAGESSNNGSTSALTELYKTQPKDIVLHKSNKPQSDIDSSTAQGNASNTDEDVVVTPDAVDEDLDTDTIYWEISSDSNLLIAEIPRSGSRWKQANFDKETFQNFFGATCGENGAYRILLKSVNSDGSLGVTEVRPSVSVSSSNYRFELDAATGIDYPSGGLRPLGIFAKVSCRNFLYELLLPNQKGYDEVIGIMNATQKRSDKMRRLRYLCHEIREKVPSLAIWKRLNND